MDYIREIYKKSIKDRSDFWQEVANKEITWFEKPNSIINTDYTSYYNWFVGAKCNTCYNAIDRHVAAGKGDKTALIYESPITSAKTIKYSYSELLSEIKKFAGLLERYQVKRFDRVAIYMPMIPQAVVAMLACARIGAIHTVVFGGFAANELANRILDTKAKIVVSASCGFEPNKVINYKQILDQAISRTRGIVKNTIIFQRPKHEVKLKQGFDLDWQAEIEKVRNFPDCVSLNSTDPLYILYTSGTTSKPKGLVRDNGGHMTALAWTMSNIYNISSDDVFFTASDIGWVVGHSYIVYAPLIVGATTILFEGKPVGTPDAGIFWKIIAKHKVKSFFTAPTAIRAIKRVDPQVSLLKDYDISSLQAIFLAGERSDSDTIDWVGKAIKVPVIDHWWQTETGWAISGVCLGYKDQKYKIGSAGRAMPGYDIYILDDKGKQLPNFEMGEIAIKLPLPPSCSSTIYRNKHAFQSKYLNKYSGYYQTGDAGYIDDEGYLYIMARTDDIINVAGHRLSTGQIEEVVASHPFVAECAVFGIIDTLKGQKPFTVFVLKDDCKQDGSQIAKEIKQLVRDKIGAVATIKDAVLIEKLPKTRSGKILRKTLSQIVNGEEITTPPTIEDASVIDSLKKIFKNDLEAQN